MHGTAIVSREAVYQGHTTVLVLVFPVLRKQNASTKFQVVRPICPQHGGEALTAPTEHLPSKDKTAPDTQNANTPALQYGCGQSIPSGCNCKAPCNFGMRFPLRSAHHQCWGGVVGYTSLFALGRNYRTPEKTTPEHSIVQQARVYILTGIICIKNHWHLVTAVWSEFSEKRTVNASGRLR